MEGYERLLKAVEGRFVQLVEIEKEARHMYRDNTTITTPLILARDGTQSLGLGIGHELANTLQCSIPKFGVFNGVSEDGETIFRSSPEMLKFVRSRKIRPEVQTVLKSCEKIGIEELWAVVAEVLSKHYFGEEKETILRQECEEAAKLVGEAFFETIKSGLALRKVAQFGGLGIFSYVEDSDQILFEPDERIRDCTRLHHLRRQPLPPIMPRTRAIELDDLS